MKFVLHQIWKILLSIIGLIRKSFRRIICRTRSRKSSGDLLPFTTNPVHKIEVPLSVPNNDVTIQSWDAWENESNSNSISHPQNVLDQTQNNTVLHRHSHADPNSQEDEPDVDFFQDMRPSFKRATKILVKKKTDDYTGTSNRFSVSSDIPFQTGADLEAWEDENNAWCDEAMEDLSEEAMAALREKRNLERNQRQAENQKKKIERESMKIQKQNGPLLNAVKLS